MAEPLRYGFEKGCDFAKKSCKEYMKMKTLALVLPFKVSYFQQLYLKLHRYPETDLET